MKKINYHTHCAYCGHAQGSVKDYVEEAINKGFTEIGFTDHAPFPDEDLGYRMAYTTLDQYILDVNDAKKQYGHKLNILLGLEIEYLREYLKPYSTSSSYYEFLLKEKGLDYLIMGEHFFNYRNGTRGHLYNIHNTEEIYEYALCCKEGLETGFFKIMCHPDLFGVNDLAWDSFYDKATDVFIEACIKTNTILEFNANGLRREKIMTLDGERHMYPLDKFWQRVKGSGVKVVIGADAHEPNQLDDNIMDRSRKYLADLGITTVDSLE